MSLYRKVVSIFDLTVDILGVCAVILILFVMFSVTFEVIMRYFLKRPTIWVVELTSYSLLYIAFLGAAWVLKIEGHVKIDLVLNHLSPKASAFLNSITSMICALTCLVIFWYSGKTTLDALQTNYLSATELETPKWIILSVIPVCSIILAVQFMRRSYQFVTGKKEITLQKESSIERV